VKVKRTTLVVLLLAAAALIAAVTLRSPAEPQYKNRTLSDWIERYLRNDHFADTNDYEEAIRAVHTIGTNALPHLLSWIQYEGTPWRFIIYTNAPRFAKRTAALLLLPNAMERKQNLALSGFFMLGTNAAPAIPELTALMADTNRPHTARVATYALAYLGTYALPPMLAALTNTNHPNRALIVKIIGSQLVPELGTNACLPLLITASQDKDRSVSWSAADYAQKFTSNTWIWTNVTPPLRWRASAPPLRSRTNAPSLSWR
jgi:hypothetical protein